jgi:hypothetical protein
MVKFKLSKKLIFLFGILIIFSFSLLILRTNFLKEKINLILFQIKEFHYAFAQVLGNFDFSFSPYIFSRFPYRLLYLLGEGEKLSSEIATSTEELKNQLEKCDCANTISQCIVQSGNCTPATVIGSACTNTEQINELKREINSKVNKLVLIREILKKEMESGLETELETLREELREHLKNKLNEFLSSTEELINLVNETKILYSQENPLLNCVAKCSPGPSCGVRICAGVSRKQKHVEIKAKVGIGIDDLKLGKVGFGKFGIALPEEIDLPPLGEMRFTIPSQQLSVCVPFEAVSLHISPPSFAHLPTWTFTCPTFPFKIGPFPEWNLRQLPPKFEIPSPPVLNVDFCSLDFHYSFSLQNELEKIRQDFVRATERKINEFKNKINDSINKINENLENLTNWTEAQINNFKNQLSDEYKEIVDEIAEKLRQAQTTPSWGFGFSIPSPEEEKRLTSESLLKDKKEVYLTYQCKPNSANSNVQNAISPSSALNWYFNSLNYLMNECAQIPKDIDPSILSSLSSIIGNITSDIINEQLGSIVGSQLCYSQDTVIETIKKSCLNSCAKYIQNPILNKKPPEICLKIYPGCLGTINEGAKLQCQEFFKINPPIPPECNTNPISTLENECSKILNQKWEEIPEPCKLLPIFKGKIEKPGGETYSSPSSTCKGDRILNLPMGFGGGIGISCPVAVPQIPILRLPDIIIPDIILPTFEIKPFFRLKLPRFFIEDIILPDIHLCDINNCAYIFPDLTFNLPQLSLPSLDFSASIPQTPNLYLRARLPLPSVNFSIPSFNLFNFLLPELVLPDIDIPSPKIKFDLVGIDMSAIFDGILAFIANALGIPDITTCFTLQLNTKILDIEFPDYYISFKKYLGKYLDKMASFEIPACKDIRNFCRTVRKSLEEDLVKKVKKIEKTMNEEISKNIQDPLNQLAAKIENKVREQVERVLEKYLQDILQQVENEIKRRGYNNIQDYLRVQTTKECFLVNIPQKEFVVKFEPGRDEVIETADKVEIYISWGLPKKLKINWPDEVREGILPSTSTPLVYELPKIPLSELSIEKEISLKLPGFQALDAYLDVGTINTGCTPEKPDKKNPFPLVDIEAKINGEIKPVKNNIENIFNEVKIILE